MADKGLTPRESDILMLLLKRYADTRKPVPSSCVFEAFGGSLAPSSVRAVLFDLEKKGYLAKEHISSGRVPTDKAFRYFADTALESLSKLAVRNSMARKPASGGGDISEMAMGMARGISETHRSVGFATAPSLLEARLGSCELYPLKGNRVVMFCVSSTGRLYERVLRSRQCYTYEQLRAFGNYITRSYGGRSFREIRCQLNNQLVRDREKVADWVLDALSLVAPAMDQVPGDADLFLAGLEWLVDIPEIASDRLSLRTLVETVEKKEKLLSLLDSILEEGKESAIVLGVDLPLTPALVPIALMAVSYGAPGSGKGVVGLIGRKAMKYDEALPHLFNSAMRLTEASINISLTGGHAIV